MSLLFEEVSRDIDRSPPVSDICFIFTNGLSYELQCLVLNQKDSRAATSINYNYLPFYHVIPLTAITIFPVLAVSNVSTNPEVLNIMREVFECSLENLLRIDTKTKRVIFTNEEDEDQIIDSPLSELNDEEMATLSITANHVPPANDKKRLDKIKTSNLAAPEQTAPTSENAHRLPSTYTSTKAYNAIRTSTHTIPRRSDRNQERDESAILP